MKLYKMQCQNCCGSVDLDFDNMILYCPYCGNKLMLDVDSVAEVLKEREKTEQSKIKHDSDNYKKKIEISLIKLIMFIWTFSLIFFAIISLFTLDNVNFSPYQTLLFFDLIGGIAVIIAFVKKRK